MLNEASAEWIRSQFSRSHRTGHEYCTYLFVTRHVDFIDLPLVVALLWFGPQAIRLGEQALPPALEVLPPGGNIVANIRPPVLEAHLDLLGRSHVAPVLLRGLCLLRDKRSSCPIDLRFGNATVVGGEERRDLIEIRIDGAVSILLAGVGHLLVVGDGLFDHIVDEIEVGYHGGGVVGRGTETVAAGCDHRVRCDVRTRRRVFILPYQQSGRGSDRPTRRFVVLKRSATARAERTMDRRSGGTLNHGNEIKAVD